MVELRPYQEAAISDLFEKLKDNPVLVAPTGSGKTVMLSAFLQRHGLRALWIAHRKELIDQAVTHLARHGIVAGKIKAGCDPTPDAPAQVASIQTLVRRETPPADVVVIDEAHHCKKDGSYEGLFKLGIPVVGATATPFRLDGKGLKAFFGEMSIAATTQELVEAGFLVAPRIFSHPAPDLRSVRKVGGDYDLGQLEAQVNTSVLVGDIVETWKKRGCPEGRRPMKTVAFAVTIAHSRSIVDAFVQAGIPAEHLDGGFEDADREAILHRLDTGETLVVSQVNIVTEGFDMPDLECAIMARPTQSLCWWLQACGRVMRPKDQALILDHSGNALRHGAPTRSIDFSLDGVPQKDIGDRSKDTKECPRCQCLVEADELQCPECGYEWEGKTRKILEADGELVEYAEIINACFDDRVAFWVATEETRLRRRYQPLWSHYRYKDRFETSPATTGDEIGVRTLVNVATADLKQKREVYRWLLVHERRRGHNDGRASHLYKEAFGAWPSGFVSSVKGELAWGPEHEDATFPFGANRGRQDPK